MTNDYDLIVIGSGAGMNVAANAVSSGLKVALVDKDPVGGTCLNKGCIPSKVWTTVADSVMEAKAAERIGVRLRLDGIDFETIKRRTWDIILKDRHEMEASMRLVENLEFFASTCEFVGDRTVKVKGKLFGKELKADKIVIASGARPDIPQLPGLEKVGFLTNDNVFSIERLPESLVIIGGGFIACEFGHFFAALGTHVTIVGRNERLMPKEDPEVSAVVQRSMAGRMTLLLGHEAVSASVVEGAKRLVVRDRRTGKETMIVAEQLLMAAGRRSNADILHPERTGVKVDAKGWIITNEYLETTKEGIWALGDCVNRGQFRHTANYHSEVVWNNAFGTEKIKLDETAIPSAVFTWPQVGTVGMLEQEAKAGGRHVHVGRKSYADIAKGYAMAEEEGFAKVVFDADSRVILGATIVGPQASVLIQQVVDLMNSGDGTFLPLARAQTIHPTLSEVIVGAFSAPVHAGGDERLDHAHTHVHVHEEKDTKAHKHQQQ